MTVRPVKGGYDNMVKTRAYRLQVPGVDPANVKVNGRKAKIEHDEKAGCPVIVVPSTSVNKEIKIEYTI